MSYYTHVDIQTSDFIDAAAAELIVQYARTYLVAQGYPAEHVLDNLKIVLSQGSGLFKGFMSGDFDGMMEYVSANIPSVTFFVRGMGEEFLDVWLRQFEAGKSCSPIGPFDVES